MLKPPEGGFAGQRFSTVSLLGTVFSSRVSFLVRERRPRRMRVRPPDDSSKIKEVKISLMFEESSDDVKDELQDAPTSNRTVDFRLSLEDVDNTLELPETNTEPESPPPFGDRSFRVVGGEQGPRGNCAALQPPIEVGTTHRPTSADWKQHCTTRGEAPYSASNVEGEPDVSHGAQAPAPQPMNERRTSSVVAATSVASRRLRYEPARAFEGTASQPP